MMESTIGALDFMNSIMEIFGGSFDNIIILALFLVFTSFMVLPFMILSLRLPRMARALLEPLSRSSLHLIRVVTKAIKLPTHVIPKGGKLIALVTPSHMLNCAKEKLTNHAIQKNYSVIQQNKIH